MIMFRIIKNKDHSPYRKPTLTLIETLLNYGTVIIGYLLLNYRASVV